MAAQVVEQFDYRAFNSRLARDLGWLLSARFDLPMPESVFPAFTPDAGWSTQQWLQQVELSGQDLGGVGKLGRYFEDLVAYYLSLRVVEGNALQRNVALRRPAAVGRGTETLGELDFLYPHKQLWQHLEVAVKFYLGIDVAGHRLWLGPNSKDRLDKKCLRMLSHQLPIACELEGFTPLRSSYWLKGILFEPWRAADGGSQSFTWLYRSDIHNFFIGNKDTWSLLPKRAWLGAAFDYAPLLQVASLCEQLEQHFRRADTGVMVINRSSVQERRCFIVADHWPSKTAS